jgi:hypothetical protein
MRPKDGANHSAAAIRITRTRADIGSPVHILSTFAGHSKDDGLGTWSYRWFLLTFWPWGRVQFRTRMLGPGIASALDRCHRMGKSGTLLCGSGGSDATDSYCECSYSADSFISPTPAGSRLPPGLVEEPAFYSSPHRSLPLCCAGCADRVVIGPIGCMRLLVLFVARAAGILTV